LRGVSGWGGVTISALFMRFDDDDDVNQLAAHQLPHLRVPLAQEQANAGGVLKGRVLQHHAARQGARQQRVRVWRPGGEQHVDVLIVLLVGGVRGGGCRH